MATNLSLTPIFDARRTAQTSTGQRTRDNYKIQIYYIKNVKKKHTYYACNISYISNMSL